MTAEFFLQYDQEITQSMLAGNTGEKKKSGFKQVGGGGRIARPGKLAGRSQASNMSTNNSKANHESSTAFGTILQGGNSI